MFLVSKRYLVLFHFVAFGTNLSVLVMIYSNSILTEMANTGTIEISPREGSYIIAIVQLFGALVAPIPLVRYGRKQLLLWG